MEGKQSGADEQKGRYARSHHQKITDGGPDQPELIGQREVEEGDEAEEDGRLECGECEEDV